MNIIKYLLEHFDVDDVDTMIEFIKSNFLEDDCVEFMNIIIMIENLPKTLIETITSKM